MPKGNRIPDISGGERICLKKRKKKKTEFAKKFSIARRGDKHKEIIKREIIIAIVWNVLLLLLSVHGDDKVRVSLSPALFIWKNNSSWTTDEWIVDIKKKSYIYIYIVESNVKRDEQVGQRGLRLTLIYVDSSAKIVP